MIDKKRKRYDLTSADTKIIGTDYQFFYFIKELLKLRKGQRIGYECKDDVHIDLTNNESVLIQLKHTTQNQADGRPINLTELDNDLLHTINNWILLVCDKEDGRDTIGKQKEYIKNTTFILATNKIIEENDFVKRIININNYKFSDFISYVENLKEKSIGESKEYLQNILNMNRKLCKSFIESISIEVQADTIIEEIRQAISEKYVHDNKINDVFGDIFYELKEEFFNRVNSNEKLLISYEEWQPRGVAIFEKYQTTNLPIRTFERALSGKFQDQPFIKELIEIGDISDDEIEEMAEYTEFMIEIEMNINEWLNNGEITLDQKQKFHSEAKLYWKNTHKKYHRNATKINEIDNANECLYRVREKEVKFDNTDLNVSLSNGEFYHLSNSGEIGWLKKWEEKYKR